MKKLLFTLILLFMFSYANAQQADIVPVEKYEDNRTWINETYKQKFKYPVTAGVFGFGYVSTTTATDGIYTYSFNDYIGNGGGFSIRGKLSFNRWFALALDMGYNHSSGDIIDYTTSFNTFEIRPTLVFQRETLRGQAGFNPWAGIGFSWSATSLTETNKTTGNDFKYSDSALGFVLNAGFNYNFKNNIYVGARADYAFSKMLYLPLYGVKIGIEAGYRF